MVKHQTAYPAYMKVCRYYFDYFYETNVIKFNFGFQFHCCRLEFSRTRKPFAFGGNCIIFKLCKE